MKSKGTKAANRTTTAAIYYVLATSSSTNRARAVGERSFAEVAAAIPKNLLNPEWKQANMQQEANPKME